MTDSQSLADCGVTWQKTSQGPHSGNFDSVLVNLVKCPGKKPFQGYSGLVGKKKSQFTSDDFESKSQVMSLSTKEK